MIHASPQGETEGNVQQRIQIVFSAPVVPLGEARAIGAPPAWLRIEPAILARWRWAGTTELIGEPLVALPRATTYRVTVAGGLTAVDGSVLHDDFASSFSTPSPAVSISRVETGEELTAEREEPRRRHVEEDQELASSDGFSIVLEWNQPVDAASLATHLHVRLVPRPLPDAGALLASADAERLHRDDPAAWSAWQRFQSAGKGPPKVELLLPLEPDRRRPHEVFYLRPQGCWPLAAAVEVEVARGVRAIEGANVLADAATASFPTPWPFVPLRLEGRPVVTGQGLEPHSVALVLSSPATWRDLAEFVSFREVGEEKWCHPKPQGDEWYWDDADAKLRLWPLQLDGGKGYDICVAPGARDAGGRELGFPWCARVRTAHRSPSFYLVEGDGVVELSGPHQLPLRSVNVTSYRLHQRRITEDELVATLQRRENDTAEVLTDPRLIAVPGRPDRTSLTPIDLDPVLDGKPALVFSQLAVAEVLSSSEYDTHESEYLRRPRTTLTQVTSLGLTVKASKHEGLLVWVTRLADTRPVAGAVVAVRDKDNRTIWRGETDAQGLTRTGPEASLDHAFVVTARVGDDLVYTRARWYEGHQGWEFNLSVDYNEVPPVTGLVWPDRGVVRPGESLHLKALLRRQEERRLRVLEGTGLTFVVRNSRSQDVAVRQARIDEWGGSEIELAIPPGASLGRWNVLVGENYDATQRRFEGEHAWTVEGSFRVAEFRRPKFRVTAEAEKQQLVAGEPLAVRIEANLLAGGPMAGAATHWTVRAAREGWSPPGSRWDGFDFLPRAFEDPFEREAPTTLAEGRGVLDAAGAIPVRLPRAEAVQGFPARLEVEGEVEDVDRQTSAATAVVTVLPGEFFLGLKRPPFFVTAEAGVETGVVALTSVGTTAPGVAVHLELRRRHWESVRRREVSGRYIFESQPVIDKVAEQDVTTTAERMSARFATAEGGEYAIVAKAKDSRGNEVSSSTEFYVFGAGFTPWRMDQENRIDLVAERERYAPGETAHVLVKSPWERTTALVTVERAGVLEARVEELVGTMPVIEIPLREEYTPNVFISVVLLRGRLEVPSDPEMLDPGRPAYRVGYCELIVPPQGRKLAVAVKVGKPEYRPGQTAQVEVQVQGVDGAPRRASLTAWAVDAGVLELTGYRTPDLFAAMYLRRGLAVSTAESRSRLVGRRSYGTKGDKPGGGGGREVAGEQVRQDFRALAVWRGDVVTDARGRAVIGFTLPDSLTTYRLMVVAAAGESEFGASETEFRVSKPLGLEPALPRFLRPEDSARAGVVVRNRTKAPQQVEVSIAVPVGSPLHLRGGASRNVTVPAGGSLEVGFGLIAVEPGIATLRFDAVSSGRNPERDSLAATLPVLALTPSETVATFFATADRASEAIAVPHDVFPGIGGLELSVATSPLLEGAPGLQWLLDYPWSCAEQISSRVLGVTAALHLGAGFAPREVDRTPPSTWLATAVQKLLACKRGDGGFAFWPDGRTSVVELSAHVAWALAAAREAGVAVDAMALDSAAIYLSRTLRQEQWLGGEEHGWTAKVLVGFALARLGRAEPAYYQALYDQRGGAKPVWGRALLAVSMLAADPADQRAKKLLQDVRNALAVEARMARIEQSAPDWGWLVWWSEPRASATALLAVLAAEPGDPINDRLARGILDHLARDRDRTTHDTAWMLQALAEYHARREAGAGRRSVVATLDGEAFLKTELGEGLGGEASGSVLMAELQRKAGAAPGRTLPLAVQVTGQGMVHASAVLSYAPRSADHPPLAQGLVLERRFFDEKDRPTAGLTAGGEATVEVMVDCPTARRFVVVEVPLPAGLEPLDPHLATTARRASSGAEAEENENGEEGGEWWHPGFDHVELRDDRIVLFATELPAGTHSFAVRCRATTAGAFLVAPAHAEEMYAPEVFATTAATRFEVFPTGR